MKTNNFFTPIVLLLISLGLFFGFIKGGYAKMQDLKKEIKVYKNAQIKADELKTLRKDLQEKLLGIGEQNIRDLEIMLPDSVDTVRLIMDISGIAQDQNIVIKSIKLNDNSKSESESSDPLSKAEKEAKTDEPYLSMDISFSVTTTYEKFIAFLSDIEESLRIIDVTSVSIKSSKESNMYEFAVNARTYWMN